MCNFFIIIDIVDNSILPLFWDMVLTSKQLAILGYQNITFDGTILILFNTNITCDCIFVIFDGSLLFFSYSMVSFLYCAVPTSHVTVFFHIQWFSLFFFLTFNGTILTLCSTNITCDCTFVTFGSSLIFFPHI